MAHAEARSRGAVHFQFCILHLSRTEDAEDTEICVVMAIDAYRCEIHDGSRGGTEPRSCAAFSIFNFQILYLSRTEDAEGAECHLPSVIPCRVQAPIAWNLRG